MESHLRSTPPPQPHPTPFDNSRFHPIISLIPHKEKQNGRSTASSITFLQIVINPSCHKLEGIIYLVVVIKASLKLNKMELQRLLPRIPTRHLQCTHWSHLLYPTNRSCHQHDPQITCLRHLLAFDTGFLLSYRHHHLHVCDQNITA